MLTDKRKKIVIVGATSLIATHCARLWVEREPILLSLVGRDLMKLEHLAADLRIRSPLSLIQTVEFPSNTPLSIQQCVDRIIAEGLPQMVFIAHGFLPNQKLCQQDLTYCEQALKINAISPVLFAEAFVGPMEVANQGTIALISSVAGDRGRRSNYIYGAAKGLITRYAQGLQQRLAKSHVHVALIKPGPTHTPMTAHLKQNQSMAQAQEVAKTIVRGIDKKKSVIYAPVVWMFIMMVVRHLPRFIFNRLPI